MPLTLLLETAWTNYLLYGGIALGVLLAIVFGAFFTKFAGLWVQCLMARADIGFFDLVAMYFRRVNPNVIVMARIMAVQSGIPVQTRDLEAHYLAGGTVPRVIRALIAADRARIALDYKMATGIDLAGRDVLDAVQMSVNPKVIDCPDPKKGRLTMDAVAKNGIQLKARARVTVRTNIERLVGGATEETIIARVGEGIVSAIGACETHKDVLEHPDLISRAVMQKGLDAGTAFEILSVDIADVDVGDNIGARLQADQAEADKRIAQAKAEERRAMAVAREQEMKALVEENHAKVVLAESEIPKGIAQAFREGNLGIMDYYRLRNIQADTGMRSSIGGTPEKPKA